MATTTVQRPNPAVESVTLVMSETEARALLSYISDDNPQKLPGYEMRARCENEFPASNGIYNVMESLDKALGR